MYVRVVSLGSAAWRVAPCYICALRLGARRRFDQSTMAVSAVNLLKEFDHIAKWVTAQRDAGVSADTIAASQFEVVQNKIKLLKNVDYDTAATLISAVQHMSSDVGWRSKQVLDLTMLINSTLAGRSTSLPGYKAAKRVSQDCHSWELYPTEAELVQMSDPRLSDRAKINVAQGRCKLMGLILPSEACKGSIAKVIAAISGKGEMPPKEWYTWLQAVKKSMGVLKAEDWKLEYISEFPLDPAQLPPDVFKHAYPDDAGPGMRSIPGLELPEFLRCSSAAFGAGRGVLCQPRGADQRSPMDTGGMVQLFGNQILEMIAKERQNQFGVQLPGFQLTQQQGRTAPFPGQLALPPPTGWPDAGRFGPLPPPATATSPEALVAAAAAREALAAAAAARGGQGPESATAVDSSNDGEEESDDSLSNDEATLRRAMGKPKRKPKKDIKGMKMSMKPMKGMKGMKGSKASARALKHHMIMYVPDHFATAGVFTGACFVH